MFRLSHGRYLTTESKQGCWPSRHARDTLNHLCPRGLCGIGFSKVERARKLLGVRMHAPAWRMGVRDTAVGDKEMGQHWQLMEGVGRAEMG